MAESKPAHSRKPLRQQVLSFLHEGILSGRYPAGGWLRQDEIARRLGVSMTPVREALDLLVSSGVAERVPYRGVRVLQLSEPGILDTYEIRLLLEAAVAQRVASEISPHDITRLQRLLDEEAQLVEVGDLPRQREISRELHGGIVAACGNAVLHRIYMDVLSRFPDWMLYEHLYSHPEILADSLCREHQEHVLIVEALAAHDAAGAMQRSLAHVRQRGLELELYVGISRTELELREAQIQRLIPDAWIEVVQGQKEKL